MMEFFDRLRAKSLSERRSIALGSTISIFAVIVFVWWTTFTSPLSTDTVKATDNVATPMAVMGGFFGQIKEQAQELPAQLKAYAENVATSSGKATMSVGDQALVSDMLSKSSTTSVPTPQPTPEPAATPVIPPLPTPPAPVEKKVSPQAPAPAVTPVPPPAPTPPAVLIPTRPGKIAP